MDKKIIIFIVSAVFASIISCKNVADLKQGVEDSVKNTEQQVKGFLETKKEELTEGLKNLGSEISLKVKGLMQADEPQGQVQEQVGQDVNNKNQEVEEIEKEIKELKDKIEKSNEKQFLKAYLKFEEEVKKIKNKLTYKEKFKKELKDLEESFKKKKDDRKNVLEEVKRKLEEYKRKVEPSTGKDTKKVKEQGKIGLEAFKYAKEFGVNGRYYVDDDTDSDDFAKKVIDDALKNIDEALQNTIEDIKE
ncbi:hypothetical protein QIA34_05335 (plasmid) [Borreliella yangtzensis]|uniref:Chromosome segregation ATPase n=1 Tax=Borreliella yangtzensis TaxID=683292 RepID=A0ABR6PBE7_9SPIR|nr:chromosome segregation ATPase [Borreliella yangtzensis]